MGETDLALLRAREFDEQHSVSRQIARVAQTLPQDGGARMAMLRLSANGPALPTACRCRLLDISGRQLVLVIAVGGTNDTRPIAERLPVLLGREAAVITAHLDGERLYANPAAEAGDGDTEMAQSFTLPSSSGDVTVEWAEKVVAPPAAVPAEEPTSEDAEPAPVPEEPSLQALESADRPAERHAGDGEGAPGEVPLRTAFDPAEAPLLTAEAVAEPEPAVDGGLAPGDDAGGDSEEEAGDDGEADESVDETAAASCGGESEAPAATPEPPLRAERSAGPSRRFTFALDAEGTVTELGPALRAAVGEPAAVSGRRWNELAQELALDPAGEIERMIETRDTWSGVVVDWPRESGGHVGVRLAALPRFGERRQFLGYRGFGEILDQAPQPEATVSATDGGISSTGPVVEAPDEVPPSAPAEQDDAEGREASNVLQLHPSQEDEALPPVRLSERERNAFQAIARVLGARLPHGREEPAEGLAPAAEAEEAPIPADQTGMPVEAGPEAPVEEPELQAEPAVAPEGETSVDEPEEGEATVPAAPAAAAAAASEVPSVPQRLTLDLLARIPWGVGIVRDEQLIYANRAFLDMFGFSDLDDLDIAGGLAALLQGRSTRESGSTTVEARHRDGSRFDIEARLSRAEWIDGPAMLLAVRRAEPLRSLRDEVERLKAIVDLASDGTVVLDADWRILEANPAAQRLIDRSAEDLRGRPFLTLVPDDNQAIAEDYLDGLAARRGQVLLDDGVELVLDVDTDGQPLPVFLTGALIEGQAGPQICIVLRDLRRWKTAEAEALTARRRAEQANEKKSDFLAKMSHEIRTPLNAIIGFAEVMLEERFGPLGNERYRDYLSDVRDSGEHIMSLVNDLLDLSKVEAGRMDLTFTGVKLNDIVEQTVAIMQPQANRQRVIIRTSLSMGIPPIVADSRSLRQVMMNLLSNGIKFTPPGGQVIVSTMITDEGDVSLRVRDTGVGMSEAETEIALEPFRQVGSRKETGVKGSGLGLPLTKALVEANRALFAIRSRPGEGTLVEITFPQSRVLAE